MAADLIGLRSEQVRLLRVLGRFVPEKWETMSDREFVEEVLRRWRRYLEEPVIDVGE
jgi:hypothetical protein